MFRRQFIQLVALLSAGALAEVEAMAASQRKTVVYRVKGFSCIACAVGLDTMLRKEKGVLSSQSTYPEGKVTVCFDPSECSEDSVRTFIANMGFTVESPAKG